LTDKETEMSEAVKKEIIEWIKVIVVAVILAGIITTFVRPTLVKGASMENTLKQYDYLLVNKMAYRSDLPERGDVIIFKSDLMQDNGREKDLVKRVVGVEGDHIIITDGKVYLNDELLNEPYIKDGYTDYEIDTVVPEGHVFAMGDNRLDSTDSRDSSVGPVPLDDIVGKVFIRLFPFNKITTDFYDFIKNITIESLVNSKSNWSKLWIDLIVF